MAKSSNLMPLLILFVLVAIAAFIGFIAYSVVTDVSDKAAKRMEKKNIKFSKDGMKLGVKEISTEDISDSTQSAFMKVLNAASGLGENTTQTKSSTHTGSRKPYSRSGSNQNEKKA